jgi:hypothetical protein
MYGKGKLGPVMAVVGTDTSIANKKRKKKEKEEGWDVVYKNNKSGR